VLQIEKYKSKEWLSVFMDASNLRELGLSEQESKIYLALVLLGKANASQISAEAKVSYGTIYNILASMERKGLVKTVPEKTKKFIATTPSELIKLVEEKEAKLKSLKKEAAELKKQYDLEEQQPIIIAQGKSNFYKLKSEMTPHNKRDYSVRSLFDPDPVTWRKMKERKAKGVDYRIIYGPNANKKAVEKYKKEKIPMVETPVDKVVLSIHDDETLITLLEKNTTILVKDKNFSELIAWMFRKIFEK
jgi:sugar-specific transcriptional regulator TrmB